MRFRDLFTVPTGQKVTEKHLRRVLISSICSILLCMTCLVSTTWAWFAVSIVNTDNVIQIGTPEVTVTVNGASFTPGDSLSTGEYLVTINRTVNEDDLQQKMEFFVILTIQSDSETPAIYKLAVSESSSVTIQTNGDCKLSWVASWFLPASADEISNGVIVVTAEDGTDPSTELATSHSTETVTEASTEATTIPSTESSTEGTVPTTVPSTEATTEPPTETTTTEATEAATEAITVPTATGETTEPTETTPATEDTTIPTADATTAPTTAPTSNPTEATEPITESEDTTSPSETG